MIPEGEKDIINETENLGLYPCSSGRPQENQMSVEQYNNVCKQEFTEIKEAIKSMEKRLFRDNGTKSIQTILTEVKLWQVAHDAQLIHDKEQAKEAKKPSNFSEWIMDNWKTVAAGMFILAWVILQFINTSRFSNEQKKEMREMLNTTIIDTRPK